ncbi:MAG: D-serine ammonia-lyase [Kiritimatiellae bacterium]|nr:D-serine ammonia-lyase [Kiritimatiellia bacterium]
MRTRRPATDTSEDPRIRRLRRKRPWLWLNPNARPAHEALPALPFGAADLSAAAERFERFGLVLTALFPELAEAGGRIASPLRPVPRFAAALAADAALPPLPGRWLVKADHALPIAGSIKARGGVHEVLYHAETLALQAGLLAPESDITRILAPAARDLFARHRLSVASTGNLGLSIGIMGAALGFRVCVHMSADAKEWKKARLRQRGVTVIEHAADYGQACALAREEAAREPACLFVDDEQSPWLFLGYSVAARELQRQLAELAVPVDAEHPLFLYLPCGVGGAPGGITFGAKHLFGDSAHCFFAEPVGAPSMLLGLLTGRHAEIAIQDIGLALETDADGLAVGRPSRLVGAVAAPLVAGCYTVTDPRMYRLLYLLKKHEDLAVEPSAAAGCAGPLHILHSAAGHEYLRTHRIEPANATHVLWTTGGAFVPPEKQADFLAAGQAVAPAVWAGFKK